MNTDSIDLNEELILRPSATYYARASGNSMTGIGIIDGDLLVIDRSLVPRQGEAVICSINGELTCKLYDQRNQQLVAANPDYPPIPLPDDLDVVLEEVVVHTIHHLRVG